MRKNTSRLTVTAMAKDEGRAAAKKILKDLGIGDCASVSWRAAQLPD